MSNDLIVAGFINKMQYVGFAQMVCGHLSYESELKGESIIYILRDFKHDTQNLHVYDRHMDAVNELLKREVIDGFEFQMYLKENKNFYDYTIDDFVIEYSHKIPKITSKLPIAI